MTSNKRLLKLAPLALLALLGALSLHAHRPGVAATPSPAATPFEPLPGYNTWRTNLLKAAGARAAYLASVKDKTPVDPALGETFYDSARTFYDSPP